MQSLIKGFSAVALAVGALSAQAATIDLAGSNASGFSAMIGLKATVDAATAATWNFPYYKNGSLYQSIVAAPLSAASDYTPYLPTGATVVNQGITAPDYATFSAGTISYDESAITGVGVETISVGALTLAINEQGLSPYHSAYNNPDPDSGRVGDFPFNYKFSVGTLTGPGLTFTNGVLTSINVNAGFGVSVQMADYDFYAISEAGSFDAAVFSGSLSISGASYAFALDADIDASSPVQYTLGGEPLQDFRFVINRAGGISAVSAVPEPSTYAMLGAGLLAVGVMMRRQRRDQA